MHLRCAEFYGGPEKQIVEHAKRLDPDKYRIIVAAFADPHKPNELLDQAKSAGLETLSIPTSRALDLRALGALKRALVDRHVALLCTHGYKPSVLGRLASKAKGVPMLAFSRGFLRGSFKVALYEWLERRAFEKAQGVVAVSHGEAKRLQSLGVKNEHIWVVHNAVSANGLRQENRKQQNSVFDRFGIRSGSKLVVSAGRLSPEKGHQYLLEAVAGLNGMAGDISFVFCGHGPCKGDLERKAGELGIADRCRFVGFRKDLDEIFAAMDLLVLPSLTEGLPNVVLEAFAVAKPVVASAVGGVPELVEDGVDGLLVPPKRPDLLAGAIEKCLSAPEKMRAMGAAGYEKVKSRFTFESQARKLEKIYQDTFERRAG